MQKFSSHPKKQFKMAIVITILTVIAALVALVLLLAVFAKKGYSIERQIVIDRAPRDVFDYVSHLRNQDTFNKWAMMDPAMKREFRGVDGTVGFVYAWDGNKKAGKGEQEIRNIVTEKRVDIEVRFVRPFPSVAQTPFIIENIGPNQTRLRWGITSSMKYPMNAVLIFMNMDKLLGSDMEISLKKLKDLLEK